jgi:SAM-dependent methyltransferase
MNQVLHGVVRAVAGAFDLPGPVLEIGSYQVPGQEDLAELRPLFPGRSYLGLDRRPGPGVDLVADGEELPLATGSIGTLLALSTLEHVPHFWRAVDEFHRVLRPDGVLVLACPFHFHIHSHPDDYWRFTPSALRLLLDRYPSRLIGWHGPRTRPANVWAVAFREQHPPIEATRIARYRHLMSRHAREPMPLLRRLRYQLGRWLCGSRPFAPWLEREHWESTYENLPCAREPRCPSTTRPDHAPAPEPGRTSRCASSTGTAATSSATVSAR